VTSRAIILLRRRGSRLTPTLLEIDTHRVIRTVKNRNVVGACVCICTEVASVAGTRARRISQTFIFTVVAVGAWDRNIGAFRAEKSDWANGSLVDSFKAVVTLGTNYNLP
jgi:hypothetical protein